MYSLNFDINAGGAVVLGVLIYFYLHATREKLDHIPTVGYSHWLLSYWDVYRRGLDISEELKEGYRRYPNAPFKVALMRRWKVIISGEQALADIRMANDEQSSFTHAVKETMHTKHTIGDWMMDEPTQIGVVKVHFTKNLTAGFENLYDEVVQSFADELSPHGKKWTSVHTQSLIFGVVARTSNRFFIGLPLCRNPDWLRLNIEFTMTVMARVQKLGSVPHFAAPFVAWWTPGLDEGFALGQKLLGPIIQNRLDQEKAHNGDWPDRPNDVITWLLEEAKDLDPSERSIERISGRVLFINLGAIHTSGLTFMNVLYTVAADDSLRSELRREVESITDEYGWNKLAMGHLVKVDSVFKESQRFYGLGVASVERMTTIPFAFSNGITLPAGTLFTVAANAMQHDDAYTENADVMDPLRYSRLREKDGEFTKHQMVIPDKSHLSFGYGKHACPGRFFAANEMKAMLAHILVTYDFRTEESGVRPPNVVHGESRIPNPKAHLLWRKRA